MGKINKNVASTKVKHKIKNHTDVVVEDIESNGNEKNVFISIKHLQSNFECFCDWSKSDMGFFWNFNNFLHSLTWEQVYSTSRKNYKAGVAYTVISRSRYIKIPFIKSLSPEITMFELRVSDRIRVHGFRDKSIFNLCILDKDHRLT